MIPPDLFCTSLPLPLFPPPPPFPAASLFCLDLNPRLSVRIAISIPSRTPFPTSSQPPPAARAPGNPCRCQRRSGEGVDSSSWDPNAESVRSGRFGFSGGRSSGIGQGDGDEPLRKEKRRWWSDEVNEDFDPFDDEFDDDPGEQPWDMIWIFKVFKSYGYLFPAIIASMLLTTGPNAFLMALALPLGQSAISLVIDKLWGKSREGPQTKTKTRKKPFKDSTEDYQKQWSKEDNYSQRGKHDYQTWVSADVGAADRGNGSVRSNLGGWDDLDMPRRKMNNSTTSQRSSSANNSIKSGPSMKGKLSRRGRHRDVPLFLRLLIALFPFLGSWTKIL